jgi:hypothetical protein
MEIMRTAADAPIIITIWSALEGRILENTARHSEVIVLKAIFMT